MFGNFFEFLYNKVLINIVVERSKTTVYVELCSKSKVTDTAEEVFDTTSINSEMQEFIQTYVSESPYYYISILDTSVSQGAVPTCGNSKTSYYKDLTSSIALCYDKKWTFYSSQEDIYSIERKYEKIGIDFIFSPFTILAQFFQDKIDTDMSLFVLLEDSYISLSIFKKSELVYAEHLDLENHIDDDMLMYDDTEEDVELMEEGIDLDNMDVVEDISSFDDFSDIEDLDAIEESEDFLETADTEEEFYEAVNESELPVHESDGFNEDYQRFLLIQSSVNNFYKSDKYESTFIQNIYMADGVGISPDLKRYLEEEMFMEVYIRSLDLPSSVCNMAKVELGL